jgi:hypothetical protein
MSACAVPRLSSFIPHPPANPWRRQRRRRQGSLDTLILATLRQSGRPLTAGQLGFYAGIRHRVADRDLALGRLVKSGQVVAASQPNPRPNSPIKVFRVYSLAAARRRWS